MCVFLPSPTTSHVESRTAAEASGGDTSSHYLLDVDLLLRQSIGSQQGVTSPTGAANPPNYLRWSRDRDSVQYGCSGKEEENIRSSPDAHFDVDRITSLYMNMNMQQSFPENFTELPSYDGSSSGGDSIAGRGRVVENPLSSSYDNSSYGSSANGGSSDSSVGPAGTPMKLSSYLRKTGMGL